MCLQSKYNNKQSIKLQLLVYFFVYCKRKYLNKWRLSNEENFGIHKKNPKLILEICTFAMTIYISLNQLTMQKVKSVQDILTLPIVYSIEFEKGSTVYKISGDSITPFEIEGITPVIKLKNGNIKNLTLISFDGEYISYISKKTVYNEKLDLVKIDNELMENWEFDGNLVNDFFFLLVESTNGEKTIDLINMQLNLEEEKVEKVNIYNYEHLFYLQYKNKLSDYQVNMLNIYKILVTEHKDLLIN